MSDFKQCSVFSILCTEFIKPTNLNIDKDINTLNIAVDKEFKLNAAYGKN